MSQWEDFFNTQPDPATANYDLDVLADFRAYRFNQSINNNPYFQIDLLAAALKYPQFLSVGGNTGKVNTFTGLDLSSLTGGVYNAQTLLRGDNLMCFAFQAAQQGAPDLLKGLLGSTLTNALSQLNAAFANVFAELSCPQLVYYR
jgi:hypothetical protein